MKDCFLRVSKTEPETKTGFPVADPLETILNVLNRDQRTILTIDRNEHRKLSSDRADELDGFSVETLPRTLEHKIRDGGYGNHVMKSSFHLLDSSGRFFNKTTTWNPNWNQNQNSTGRKFHYLDGLMSKLGEVFIVGVCLLTIIRVPTVMSAPSIRHIKTFDAIHTPESSTTHNHRTGDEAPSYKYPCGKNVVVDQDYATTPGEIDEEFFQRILIETNKTLSYTLSFRNGYILETFQLPFEEHHNQWKNRSYDWLPNDKNGRIPKRLGEKAYHMHPSERSLDEFLVKIYEHLQRFAIGLDQVVLDQKKVNGDFVENFEMTENYLMTLLCVIKMAMDDRKVTFEEDVSESIMENKIRREPTPSHRNLRDWLIFRDLMNCLEYMRDVFISMCKNLPKSSAASLSSSS